MTNTPSYTWSFGRVAVTLSDAGWQHAVPWADFAAIVNPEARGQPVTVHQHPAGGWMITLGPVDAMEIHRAAGVPVAPLDDDDTIPEVLH